MKTKEKLILGGLLLGGAWAGSLICRSIEQIKIERDSLRITKRLDEIIDIREAAEDDSEKKELLDEAVVLLGKLRVNMETYNALNVEENLWRWVKNKFKKD